MRSNMDWCARCSRRMVGLNPGLTAEQALDLAHELSLDDSLRCKSPELVAEDLHQRRAATPTTEEAPRGATRSALQRCATGGRGDVGPAAAEGAVDRHQRRRLADLRLHQRVARGERLRAAASSTTRKSTAPASKRRRDSRVASSALRAALASRSACCALRVNWLSAPSVSSSAIATVCS